MDFKTATPNQLSALLKERFGPLWITLEAKTILDELESVQLLNEEVINKIYALRTLLLTDSAFEQYSIFSPTIKALNGDTPDFATMIPPTLKQLVIGLYEMLRIRDLPLSAEVKQFIATILVHEGIVKTSPTVPVQPEIDNIINHKYSPKDLSLNNAKLEVMDTMLQNYASVER